MNQANSSVRNISDTARWVAYFRARETQRADALFRDPFAERLAGERGFEIANTLAQGNKHEWAWVARTYLFDQFISREIEEGTDLVVNLAAGLDARPYRMDLPAALQWVEVDLPEIVSYKEEILGSEKSKCLLERIRLDLSDMPGRRALFAELDRRAKKITVVTEGLLIYFSAEEVSFFRPRSCARRPLSKLDYRSCFAGSTQINAALNGETTQRSECRVQVRTAGRREFLRFVRVEGHGHPGILEDRSTIGSSAGGVTFVITRTERASRELSVDGCLPAQAGQIADRFACYPHICHLAGKEFLLFQVLDDGANPFGWRISRKSCKYITDAGRFLV